MRWLSSLLTRLAAALIAAWFGERRQADASEAAIETKDVITEAADARASVPSSPVDADNLARELRAEGRNSSAGSSASARRRRPF